jgi:hypothetical protein
MNKYFISTYAFCFFLPLISLHHLLPPELTCGKRVILTVQNLSKACFALRLFFLPHSEQVQMERPELDSSQFSLNSDPIGSPLDSFAGAKTVQDGARPSESRCSNVPDPPPLPATPYRGQRGSRALRKVKARRRVPEAVLDSWDMLFSEAYQADLRVSTDDGSEILAHYCVLVSTQLSGYLFLG